MTNYRYYYVRLDDDLEQIGDIDDALTYIKGPARIVQLRQSADMAVIYSESLDLTTEEWQKIWEIKLTSSEDAPEAHPDKIRKWIKQMEVEMVLDDLDKE